ncbi:LysM peptidoglycan-binding domain-containing protein [Streptococcus pluranimalium]
MRHTKKHSYNTSQASSGSPAKTYTVKAGDSVWLIAHNHGISMDDLVKWNNIKNYTIHPGQQVVVKPASPAKSSDTSQATSATSAKTYTVKAGDSVWPGDSVWLIASIHGISMEELIALNDIKDYTIHPNQTLIVESITNKEAKKAAEELGYRKVNELSKSGKPIFENKKKETTIY